MTKNITPELVKKFHKYLSKSVGFVIVDKKDAFEMELIAEIIPQFVPIDSKSFLNRFSTTIYDRVYIPYEIEKGPVSRLLGQIMVLTHEAQHVIDFKSKPSRMPLYLIFDNHRLEIEIHAMISQIYLQWWYNKSIPNLTNMARKLYYYGLSENDRRIARQRLLIHAPIAKKGVVPKTSVARRAIAWLNRNCK